MIEVPTRPTPPRLDGVTVAARIPPADVALMDRIAAASGARRSDVVRHAVDEYLARHTQELAP